MQTAAFTQRLCDHLVGFGALEISREALQVLIRCNDGLVGVHVQTSFFLLCVGQVEVKLLAEQTSRLLHSHSWLELFE